MFGRSLVILLALYGILVAEQVAANIHTTSASESQVVVYYFHRTSRCHSCLTIEANIDDALKAHFADALHDGSLLWLPTNTEEPENAHFEEDFSLEFSKDSPNRVAEFSKPSIFWESGFILHRA